ncbi:hypothetical protein F5144DRAFT_596790 [Chaetomium tenue]|uniref:Uncharacterized protein n=1 Tax=Chaetomium tenue TaxID=1854479 RepID=A0ACB7NUR8_9PEZI|nr:hypothetical protein F5144DRAFT_596790 [Chaetomium globosum]
MVTRKPLPESAALDPTVPRDALSPHHGEDEAIWRDGTQQRQPRQMTNFTPADLPRSLQPGPTDSVSELGEEDNIWAERVPALNTGDMNQVPAALRPGGSHGVEADLGPGGSSKPETNPFKRKMSLSASGAGQSRPAAPSNIPPVPSVPVVDFSQLGENESRPNPWQSPVDEASGITPPAPRLLEQDYDGNNAWASARPSRQPTPGLGSESPALVSLPSEEGQSVWGEEPKGEGQGAWGEELKGLTLSAPPVAAGTDDWNLIDLEPNPEPLSRQSTWENFKDEEPAAQTAPATAPATAPKADPEVPPAAVPQAAPLEELVAEAAPTPRPNPSAELPPAQPPRPVDKSETYQVKNISWHDATAAKNPRTSPILVQNANGPCPLVALVNALTLTTPAEKTNTALVETLRSREQVSLGLLLDALDVALPDVTELYDFLKGLHTGMNVNPRFVPTPEVVTAFKRTSLTHLHPTERTDMIPGTFEHTREMVLYSTFSIPLIHGWLPAKDDAVCEALSRQAASYEDTQNLLFREEELDQKLCDPNQGLTPQEQQLYQDVLSIKSFLSTSATQLTKAGLNIIKTAMKPGSMAILFRNDHFSTLYRHPQTLELFTLVTDAGYAGHAEVVWESLVDINGERAEFFSGDFRLVGGVTGQVGFSEDGGFENWTDAVSDNNNDWTTVQPRRGHTQTAQQSASAEPPLSPNHEQEDRDLALALQLQEEEDERARTEQERRRREQQLSEQFIQQDGRAGGAAGARMTNRPAEDGLDDAPPSYEQAAKQLPYVPPQGHPSHPGSTGTASGSRPGQGQGSGPRPQQQRQQQQQQQGSPRPGAPLGGRSPAMGMGMGAGGIIVPQQGRGNGGYPGADGRGGAPMAGDASGFLGFGRLWPVVFVYMARDALQLSYAKRDARR